MYSCPRRKVWQEDMKTYLDVVHAVIYLSPEGKQIRKMIEVPPYSFVIQDEDDEQSTVINKLTSFSKFLSRNKIWEFKFLLRIPAVLECRWDDREAVFEKVQCCLVFS